MGLETSQEDLTHEHMFLEKSIEKEMARPSADSLRISRLKKRKLLIKDQLMRLRNNA